MSYFRLLALGLELPEESFVDHGETSGKYCLSLTHLLETPILHGCCSEIYEIVGDIPSSDRASGIAHRSRDSYPRSEETKNVWLKGHTGVYYVVLFSDLSIF